MARGSRLAGRVIPWSRFEKNRGLVGGAHKLGFRELRKERMFDWTQSESQGNKGGSPTTGREDEEWKENRSPQLRWYRKGESGCFPG